MARRAVIGICALIVLQLLVSCALTDKQKKATRSFGSASKVLGELSSEQYPKLRQMQIDLNKAWIILSGLDKTTIDDDFELVLDYKVLDLDGGFNPDEVKSALSATKALVGFSEAVVAIVDYDSEAALMEAANKLTGSLKGVKVDGKQLVTDGKADALGDVVRIIGGWWIESERRKGLNDVVDAYRPLIPKLVNVMKKDLDPRGKGGVAVGLFVSAKTVATFAQGSLSSGDIEVRQQAMEAYELAASIIRDLDTVFTRVVATAAKLSMAIDTLDELLADDKVSVDKIQDLYKAAKDLVDSFEALGK